MIKIKKIFLTGQSSFIGKNIYNYLLDFQDKYSVYAPSHAELDLSDEKMVDNLFKRKEFDIVIHAAMYNKDFDNPKMLSDSLKMFYNLEKNSKKYEKMYYFGSGAEFDKTLDIMNVSENDFGKSIPKNYYGFAKYIMNKESSRSKNIYNLRLFGVYGKYEDYNTKFISNAIYRVLNDKPITISQNVYFDYLYVDDLCKIVEKFLNINPKYHDYNICSGQKIDLYSLAKKVLSVSQKSLDIVVLKEGLKEEYTGCNERMLNEINCQFTDIDLGISNLYNWYENNKEAILL